MMGRDEDQGQIDRTINWARAASQACAIAVDVTGSVDSAAANCMVGRLNCVRKLKQSENKSRGQIFGLSLVQRLALFVASSRRVGN